MIQNRAESMYFIYYKVSDINLCLLFKMIFLIKKTATAKLYNLMVNLYLKPIFMMGTLTLFFFYKTIAQSRLTGCFFLMI